ncbi:MAG TPA: hypothetical protein DD734_07375 [Firmicutes bacterium]|nr:hypothetical protein [Bacillota bacterium]HBR29751.1 hypothetical protein [Bacillota bacterium]HBR34436.1 hypothetical protein [Bacillota bacterium]
MFTKAKDNVKSSVGEGVIILEEIIGFLEQNRTGDWRMNIAFLKGKGQLRLVEAGCNLRVYQFVSYDGDRCRIRLFYDGVSNYTEIV